MSDDETTAQRPSVLMHQAATRLEAAGLPSAMVDARTLLSHVLGVEPMALATVGEVSPDDATRYRQLVLRRAKWEPLQYLTGVAFFRHERLRVGAGVFIPRPETEGLVQLVIDWLGSQAIPAPVVVDLGTGSGAIAKALAHETTAVVHAVEVSPEAMAYARRNMPAGVDLRLGDWANTFDELDGGTDVVVSNPPYIPSGNHDGLPTDVALFEPDQALFAGPDGLASINELVPIAARLLRGGGLLAFEHDDTHGILAPKLVATDGRFEDIADHQDLAGRARYVTALRLPG